MAKPNQAQLNRSPYKYRDVDENIQNMNVAGEYFTPNRPRGFVSNVPVNQTPQQMQENQFADYYRESVQAPPVGGKFYGQDADKAADLMNKAYSSPVQRPPSLMDKFRNRVK
jgi:hypothetical protein